MFTRLLSSLLLVVAFVACSPVTPIATPRPTNAPILSTVLENFQAEQSPFGGNTHCEAKNGATLQCVRGSDGLQLTYADVSVSAYAIWWEELRGIATDLSHQLLLAVRMRGLRGGELPHIYLVDQSG